MKKELTALIKSLKDDAKIFYYDEIRTKQAIILPALHAIGWNIFDVEEVFPDYPVGGGNVDFSLRYDNENKVFLMVRRPGEDLAKYEPLLIELGREGTAGIGVLTNGIEWHFYLPNRAGGEQYKFHTLSIVQQNIEDLVKKFVGFLSRDHVRKGKAEEEGEKVFRSRKKKRLIREALTDVWNDNISGSDPDLLEMLAKKAEKISGYPPEPDIVQTFIKSALKKGTRRKTAPAKPTVKKKPGRKRGRKPTVKAKSTRGPGRKPLGIKRETFIGKKPRTFTFLGQTQKVRKWKEILTNVCNLLAEHKAGEFEKVLDLTGRKRRYFSRNPEDLKEPRIVSGTDIYVETNFNAQNLINIAYKVLKAFGFEKEDIQFETK